MRAKRKPIAIGMGSQDMRLPPELRLVVLGHVGLLTLGALAFTCRDWHHSVMSIVRYHNPPV